MASDGAKWSQDETSAFIDAFSDAKTSAEPMTTNKDLYSSIKGLLEQNNDIQRTAKQIETKLKKLKSGYSKLKDRMKISGAERRYDSKALSSQEKAAFQHWDKLDCILGRLSYVCVTNRKLCTCDCQVQVKHLWTLSVSHFYTLHTHNLTKFLLCWRVLFRLLSFGCCPPVPPSFLSTCSFSLISFSPFISSCSFSTTPAGIPPGQQTDIYLFFQVITKNS